MYCDLKFQNVVTKTSSIDFILCTVNINSMILLLAPDKSRICEKAFAILADKYPDVKGELSHVLWSFSMMFLDLVE